MFRKLYYFAEVRARHLPTIMIIETETLSAESRFLKVDTYFQGLRLHAAGNS